MTIGMCSRLWHPHLVRFLLSLSCSRVSGVPSVSCCSSLHCSVVIWDIARKEAVCGSQAAMTSAGPVYALAFCQNRDDIFVTGGE